LGTPNNMKYAVGCSDFFTDYFLATQGEDGSWTALSENYQNDIAKIVYTCQVLLALKECFSLTPGLKQIGIKGIGSLENIGVSNPLFQYLLKLKSLNAWKDYASIDSLKDQTIYRLENKIGDFGGRLNSYSFELMFSLEVLLDCDLFSELRDETKRKYEVQLDSLLKQGPSYLPDISHYSWILDIKLRLGNESITSWVNCLARELSKYPYKDGLWLLRTDWDKPSNTPALRCNEFLTAHLILSCSRILASHYHEQLYTLLLDSVKYFIYSFNLKDLWVTHSLLTGSQSADPYMSGLILRSIHQFSAISDESYETSVLQFEKAFEGYDQNSKHMHWYLNTQCQLAEEQTTVSKSVTSGVSAEGDKDVSTAKAEGLLIEYDNGPVVVFNGTEIKEFDAELSFAMLVNLAARRKVNKPEKGLAHKGKDLGDKPPKFANYGNLRRSLVHYSLSKLLKPSGKGDHRVYLAIDPKKIRISRSMRDFRSVYRQWIEQELDELDEERSSRRQLEDCREKLKTWRRRMNRNEDLIDDAINRLGYQKRMSLPLEQLRKRVESVLSRIDELVHRSSQKG